MHPVTAAGRNWCLSEARPRAACGEAPAPDSRQELPARPRYTPGRGDNQAISSLASYHEQPIGVRGAVVWMRDAAAAERARILPDGCMDLLWDGAGLVVAGPDSAARWHESPIRSSYAAIRFAGGTGPALLGIPAHEVRDCAPPLAQIWSESAARELTEQVAADPRGALVAWAEKCAAHRPIEPFGARVLSMARGGLSVAQMADRLAMSPRQVHRRCLPVFGYGPNHLTRVVRLGRALERARGGARLADVASIAGYADQAHLARDVRDLTGVRLTDLLSETVSRTAPAARETATR